MYLLCRHISTSRSICTCCYCYCCSPVTRFDVFVGALSCSQSSPCACACAFAFAFSFSFKFRVFIPQLYNCFARFSCMCVCDCVFIVNFTMLVVCFVYMFTPLKSGAVISALLAGRMRIHLFALCT